MTFTPKQPKPTSKEELEAYMICTDRDDNRCQRCLRNCGPVQRDHRQNRSQGALTLVSGLQCLGLGCHEWKTTHPKLAIEQGWACPGWADPEKWPAARYVHLRNGTYRLVWVLYDNYGDWQEISAERAERIMREGARR